MNKSIQEAVNSIQNGSVSPSSSSGLSSLALSSPKNIVDAESSKNHTKEDQNITESVNLGEGAADETSQFQFQNISRAVSLSGILKKRESSEGVKRMQSVEFADGIADLVSLAVDHEKRENEDDVAVSTTDVDGEINVENGEIIHPKTDETPTSFAAAVSASSASSTPDKTESEKKQLFKENTITFEASPCCSPVAGASDWNQSGNPCQQAIISPFASPRAEMVIEETDQGAMPVAFPMRATKLPGSRATTRQQTSPFLEANNATAAPGKSAGRSTNKHDEWDVSWEGYDGWYRNKQTGSWFRDKERMRAEQDAKKKSRREREERKNSATNGTTPQGDSATQIKDFRVKSTESDQNNVNIERKQSTVSEGWTTVSKPVKKGAPPSKGPENEKGEKGSGKASRKG